MGWHWHQLDHMQILCTSLQIDNYTSTSQSQLSFAGQTLFLSHNQQHIKHWRHKLHWNEMKIIYNKSQSVSNWLKCLYIYILQVFCRAVPDFGQCRICKFISGQNVAGFQILARFDRCHWIVLHFSQFWNISFDDDAIVLACLPGTANLTLDETSSVPYNLV